MVAGGVDERQPLLAFAGRIVQHELEVDVDEAGNVLRPLDVSAHPVDGVGDSAEHVQWFTVSAVSRVVRSVSRRCESRTFAPRSSVTWTVSCARWWPVSIRA